VWSLLVVAAAALVFSGAPALAEAPKVSTYAPAEDLVSQVDRYVEDLQQAVESEKDYDELKVVKVSNTLMLVSVALGLHDTDNKYKASAGAIFKASQDLAKAKNYAEAKQGVQALKAAVAEKGTGTPAVKWEKGASLDAVFKQSQTVVNSLKRYTKGSRFKKTAKDTAGFAAVLAVIAEGAAAAVPQREALEALFAPCAGSPPEHGRRCERDEARGRKHGDLQRHEQVEAMRDDAQREEHEDLDLEDRHEEHERERRRVIFGAGCFLAKTVTKK
jgi:hypothetical protein